MDTEPGPSRGLRPVKQEVGVDSGFDLLNLLATVATQELKIHTVEDDNDDTGSDTITNGDDMYESDDEEFDKFGFVKEEEDVKPSTRSLQPKKLAEMDLVDLEQIKAMSGNTLVRIFAETDFDELKRMYSYSCLLLPVDCKEKFQSFGNESKAKKDIRQHLEKHVDQLLEAGATGFTAEPIIARKKRLLGLTTTVRPLVKKRGIVRIKVEPDVSSGASAGIEKENSNNCPLKRRKDDPGFKPLLSEISNEQDPKRPRVKKEFNATKQDVSQDFYEPMYEEFDQAPLYEGYQLLRRLEAANAPVKQEEVPMESKNKCYSGQVVMAARVAIDEDHCYAAKPGQIKPEYVDYDSDSQFEEIDEKNRQMDTYSTYDPQARDGGQFTMVDQYSYSCAVDGTPTVEVRDYPSEPTQAHFYSQELSEISYMQDPTFVQTIQPENSHRDIQQSQVQVEMETNLVDEEMVGGHEKQKPVRKTKDSDGARVKNKKTLAAVSREDKLKALNAMDQLRARGATTEDLKCRLCTPPRPFTAYSTLLTHYKSHAGLRPFECTICQAAFTRQHSLNYHLMTHANQTRFTCPHCSRKFRHPTHFKVRKKLFKSEELYIIFFTI